MTLWHLVGRQIAGNLTMALAVRLAVAAIGGGLAALLVAALLGAR